MTDEMPTESGFRAFERDSGNPGIAWITVWDCGKILIGGIPIQKPECFQWGSAPLPVDTGGDT